MIEADYVSVTVIHKNQEIDIRCNNCGKKLFTIQKTVENEQKSRKNQQKTEEKLIIIKCGRCNTINKLSIL